MKYGWEQFDRLMDWVIDKHVQIIIIAGILVFIGVVTQIYIIGMVGILLLAGYFFFMMAYILSSTGKN